MSPMKSSLLKSALVAVVGLALCAPVALQAQTNTVNSEATVAGQEPDHGIFEGEEDLLQGHGQVG